MAEEKQFEERVKAFLISEDIYPAGMPEDEKTAPDVGWYFKVWGGGYQTSGIPDILLCINGYFVAVELKGTTGRASDLQKKNIQAMRTAGGFVFVLYPSAEERFKQFVRNLKHGIYNRDEIPMVWR